MKLSAFEKMAFAILGELLSDSKRSKGFRRQLVQLARNIMTAFPDDFVAGDATGGNRP
jgi:hypothetical protein